MENFLEAVAGGGYRCDLFVFPDAVMRDIFRADFADAANALGLCPLVHRSDNTIRFGDDNLSVARLCIAHKYLDRQVEGLEFHRAYGLEYLDDTEDGERIQQVIGSRVRL